MSHTVFLSDVVRYVAARLHQAQATIPLKDERPWHIGLYKTLNTKADEVPAALESLQFDWTGSYPRLRALSEYLEALHTSTSVSVKNPFYDSIHIDDGTATLWAKGADGFPLPERHFLSQVFENVHSLIRSDTSIEK